MSLSKKKLLKAFNNCVQKKQLRCLGCGGDSFRATKDKYILTCCWSKCRKNVSLLSKTLFHHMRLPLYKILRIIRMWCCKVQGRAISELLGVNKNTVSRIIKEMGELIVTNYNRSVEKIGGPGVVVEIDESKFGKVKYHRGHRVEGVWVFGMVERTPERRIVFVQVDDRKRETLESLLERYVHKESVIYSDCWRAYSHLSSIFAGHSTVNHSVTFVNRETGTHTNTIEGNWAGVKEQVSPVHRTKRYVDLYLVRFVLKRNYKKKMFKKVIKLLLD